MKNKNSKTRIQIIFGLMLFTLILTAELYVMINFPNMILVLAGMVIVDLVCLYAVIDGIVVLQRQINSRQEEQYDSIFKSQKASYMMLKKYFVEIEERLDDLESLTDIPREEIVNAQKGIAKVIINRSLENTQALMSSYEEVKDQIDQFQKEVENITQSMHHNYEEALEKQRTTGSSAEDVVQNKMKDMLIALKDMEIRLNSAIMQMQGNMMQATATMSQQNDDETLLENEDILEESPDSDLEMPEIAAESENDEEIFTDFDAVAEEYEPEAAAALKSIIELGADDPEEYEELLEMESLMSAHPDAVMTPEAEIESAAEKSAAASETEQIPIEEEIVEEPAPEEEKIEEKKEEVLEIEETAEAETQEEKIEKEKSSEKKKSSKSSKKKTQPKDMTTSETVEAPDLSDPNKSLSPDEIAALFANMGS